jgi:hypothetical protein
MFRSISRSPNFMYSTSESEKGYPPFYRVYSEKQSSPMNEKISVQEASLKEKKKDCPAEVIDGKEMLSVQDRHGR